MSGRLGEDGKQTNVRADKDAQTSSDDAEREDECVRSCCCPAALLRSARCRGRRLFIAAAREAIRHSDVINIFVYFTHSGTITEPARRSEEAFQDPIQEVRSMKQQQIESVQLRLVETDIKSPIEL